MGSTVTDGSSKGRSGSYHQAPRISFRPSKTCASSSGDARPRRFPIRSLASVRIWLIFTQERFGKREVVSSSVSGKPARCGWLVSATAITVHHPLGTCKMARGSDPKAVVDPELVAWTARVRAFAQRVMTPELERLRVRGEDKDAIAAFHWRGAPDEQAAAAAVAEIAEHAQQEGFVVHWGRKVLEVRPPVALDKGLGITALLRGSPVTAALYVGDDSTDLDAFRGLRRLVESGRLSTALCAAVSSDEAPEELAREADLTVEGTTGVRELLEALL